MLFQALTLALLADIAFAQVFQLNTPPSIQQCVVAALSWSGGAAPFALDAIPANQPSASALTTIASNVRGQSYSWTVDLAQGTAITIRITDSTGLIAYSSSLQIQTGSNGCLGSSSPSSTSSRSSLGTAQPSSSSSSGPSASAAPAGAGAGGFFAPSGQLKAATPAMFSSGICNVAIFAEYPVLRTPTCVLGAWGAIPRSACSGQTCTLTATTARLLTPIYPLYGTSGEPARMPASMTCDGQFHGNGGSLTVGYACSCTGNMANMYAAKCLDQCGDYCQMGLLELTTAKCNVRYTCGTGSISLPGSNEIVECRSPVLAARVNGSIAWTVDGTDDLEQCSGKSLTFPCPVGGGTGKGDYRQCSCIGTLGPAPKYNPCDLSGASVAGSSSDTGVSSGIPSSTSAGSFPDSSRSAASSSTFVGSTNTARPTGAGSRATAFPLNAQAYAIILLCLTGLACLRVFQH